jgi:methylated-DNA-[protein]-cysteine S-methyltransferase
VKYSVLETPIGEFVLLGDGEAITEAFFANERTPTVDWARDDFAFKSARAQLEAYFNGQLREFDLNLAPKGTPFQRAVWDAVTQVDYGHTTTYATIANELGKPSAYRAVGAANGRNPISIIVPCHRVLGTDGGLTGYGGGLHRKRWLLDLEGTR